MNRFGSLFKPLMWFMAILLAAFVAGCGGGGDGGGTAPGAAASPPTAAGAGTGVGGAGQGPAPVNLASAVNFAILANTAITNIPTSAVTGDVGLSPATGASIGLTCAEVTGVIYSVNAAGPLPCRVTNAAKLTAAVNDAGSAFGNANGRAPDYTELGAGNIGGLNLGPATYKWGTGVLIPTNVTLTGGPNDVWIFQIAQDLTVSSGVQIILAGGALPENVYWAVGTAANLDTTSQFKGVLISGTSIAMNNGATINGKLFAHAAVTLNTNTVGP